MTKARLSTKGQLVIPKEMRERHGWPPGTELEVVDQGSHLLILSSAAPPVTEVEDLLRKSKEARFSLIYRNDNFRDELAKKAGGD